MADPLLPLFAALGTMRADELVAAKQQLWAWLTEPTALWPNGQPGKTLSRFNDHARQLGRLDGIAVDGVPGRAARRRIVARARQVLEKQWATHRHARREARRTMVQTIDKPEVETPAAQLARLKAQDEVAEVAAFRPVRDRIDRALADVPDLRARLEALRQAHAGKIEAWRRLVTDPLCDRLLNLPAVELERARSGTGNWINIVTSGLGACTGAERLAGDCRSLADVKGRPSLPGEVLAYLDIARNNLHTATQAVDQIRNHVEAVERALAIGALRPSRSSVLAPQFVPPDEAA